MARRRTLRPDEEELWQAVARTAQPMHPKRVRTHLPKDEPALPPIPAAPAFPHFSVGEKVRHAPVHDLVPSLRDHLAAQPVRMDARNFARMSRGKLAPEARIDLHGMTLTEAHPELIRFILNAHADGLRLVLVITGKGSRRPEDHGPIPQRQGVLRHQVPHWLRLPPLGSAVLQVAVAHLKHGGEGAYYVYLRRTR
ncbi:DNA-nicking Smr family endonuclease [Cereibacter ovatus]|uniref:DNA-nicking Smr family endonuclease n=1 Tax=Cereibacter ovatus TaxID=439529 RepID=A0A285CXR1_9RHOB|nr:Smr/MutS family protein [Cereibacter ovatus]SNX72377.1 DNA-nicking Smr family endonuclease [Cereibacter ovatus]